MSVLSVLASKHQQSSLRCAVRFRFNIDHFPDVGEVNEMQRTDVLPGSCISKRRSGPCVRD